MGKNKGLFGKAEGRHSFLESASVAGKAMASSIKDRGYITKTGYLKSKILNK